MRIGLLICDKLPPAMERRGISHASLIEGWLGQSADNVTFRRFRAYAGKLPPKVTSCDCYFVSGSSASVADQEPWVQELCNFLLVSAKAQVPCIGLCFGHQALAQALGGRAARAPKGWELGVRTWKVVREEAWMRESGKKLSLLAINRDQVVKLPPRTVRVASSDTCPNALFRLANHAIGIQAHPEFTLEVFEELLEARASLFSPEQLEDARASLDTPVDSEAMSRWCVNFVKTRA